MRIGVKARLALYLVVFSAFVVGGVLLAGRGWQDRALVRPVPNGLTAVGHVVGYKTSVYKGASYAAVVQYEAADGQVVRFTAPSTIHRPHIGATVKVSYLLLRPFQAHKAFLPTNGFGLRTHLYYFPNAGNPYGANALKGNKAHGTFTLSRSVFNRGKFPRGTYTKAIHHKGPHIP